MKDDFILGSVKTYAVNTRKILKLYEKKTDKDAPKLQGSPKQRHKQALDLLDKISGGSENSPPPSTELADIDDIPPNIFFDALYAAATDERFEQSGDYTLRDFLRLATSKATQEMETSKRLNIGNNFHFQRMFQYIKEFEEWAGEEELGFSIKILNASGAGSVAQYPEGPDKLKIRIWHDT